MMKKTNCSRTLILGFTVACLFGTMLATQSAAQTASGPVELNETNFPDEVFREYIQKHFDRNDDLVLSAEEIDAITQLDIAFFSGSTSLQGIEFFSNLQSLDCENSFTGKKITSLDVSKNTKLQYLNCRGTDISSLDVSNNPDLRELNCVATDLTELDVSHNKNLVKLECWSTGIARVDVSQNDKLEDLETGWSLALVEVNLGQKEYLTKFACNRSNMTSVDLSGCPALKSLVCWESEISSLDLSHNPNLEALWCYDTNIRFLDLTHNPKLQDLGADSGVTLTGLKHDALAVALEGSHQLPNVDSSVYPIKVIEMAGTSFCLPEQVPGLEVSKISEVTLTNGATWNERTGTIENISDSTDVSYLYTTDAVNSETGAPIQGRIQFQIKSTGELQNGWVMEDGVPYWYENGVKQGTEGRGKEIHGPDTDAWYWLDATQGGAKTVNKDVYQESEAGQWADRPDGTGKWVRYDENGHMVKGWQTTDSGLYYFDPVYGTMAKGEAVIDGKACYFDPVTGIGANKVWVEIDGNEYWYENAVRQGYDPQDANFRGKEIYDPASDAWYWLDNIDEGKKAVSKDVYQESEAGQWADRPDGTGKWVRYDENGHMVKGWQTTENGTYYFDPQYGTMAKGEAVIDGVSHYFDPVTGAMQS